MPQFPHTQEVLDAHDAAEKAFVAEVLAALEAADQRRRAGTRPAAELLAQYARLSDTLAAQAGDARALSASLAMAQEEARQLREAVRQRDEQVARLTAQINDMTDHPDVKAARLKSLRSREEAIRAEIARLVPTPAEPAEPAAPTDPRA